MKKYLFLIVCCLLRLDGATAAETFSVGPHAFLRDVLDNGLTALALQSTNQTADIYLCVDVGKRQESNDTTGLAHLTEHILFAGTEKWGGQEFERTIRQMKGRANAYTRDDYTLYYDVNIPLVLLDQVLTMEADRLRNLTFQDGPFKHERERLRKEEAGDYRIAEQLHEWVDSVVFTEHPYGAGVRIDGHTTAIDIDAETTRAFYDAHYHPRNTAVLIVSSETAENSLARIKTAFAALPAGPERTKIPPPSRWSGKKDATFETELRQDRVEYVWLSPAPADPAFHAVQVLGEVLGNRGQRGKTVVSVGVGSRVDGDVLRVWGTGADADKKLEAFFEALENVPFSEEELTLAQNSLANDYLELGIHTRPYFSLPARLAQYHANTLPDFVPAFSNRIQQVTLDGLNLARKRWLDSSRRVRVHFQGRGKKIELPEDRQALARFASDAQEAGNLEEAVEAYTRLLSYKNNMMFEVIYLASRGQVYLDAKQYEPAIADFKQAISLSDYPALPPLLEEARRLQEETLGRMQDGGPPEAKPAVPEEKSDLHLELEELIPKVSAEIEAWRGLKFKHPVAVTFTNKTEAGKQGGWYNSETKKLVVIVQNDRPQFSRGVLLHELVHALQDQHFDLLKLHEQVKGRDADNALTALIEGEAMLAVSELMNYNFLAHAKIRDKGPVPRDSFTKKFHYGAGLLFVRNIRDSRGWTFVDKAFQKPPTTTAMIYRSKETLNVRAKGEAFGFDPVVVKLEEREIDVGMFDLRWLLTRPVKTRAQAEEITRSSLNVRCWESAEDSAQLIWEVTFGSKDSADTARSAIQRVYELTPPVDKSPAADKRVTFMVSREAISWEEVE